MATRKSQLIVELLDRVSAPARRASDALRGLGRTARNEGSQPATMIGRINRAMATNAAAMDSARAGVVDAVGAYYTLASAIGAPVRAAMEFESAMADVKKVVDFGSPEDVKAFERGLMDMTKRVPMAVNGLAAIAAAAGQSGIAKDDILAFTEAAAQIGVAFDISAEEAGTAMAKLMTGLGLTLPEVQSLTDAMNHLSNKQASSAAEILDIVRRVGAQGKQYGFTAEQVAAFGSAMVSSGAQTDVAATSFMNMGRALTRGASATKRQREAYKALGMDAEKVARAMQKDAVKTTVTVMEAIAALPKEQQAAISSDLFGDEARALGPLLTNLNLVRESLGLVGDESQYAGSAIKEFEVRAKTFQNRMQLFNNALARTKVVIGNALLPILTELMDRLEPIIDRISEWVSANPELVSGIIAATAGLIAFRGAMAALRFVGLLGAGGALNLLALGMNTVGVAAGRMWGASRAAIALQAALGRMSGGQAMTSLQKLGTGLAAAVRAAPGMGIVTGALKGIAGAATAVAGALAGISAPVWGAIAIGVAAVAYVGYQLWKYWDQISSVFSGVARRLGEELAPAIEAIRPALDWLAPVGAVIAAGWERAKAGLAAFWDWLGGLFQREVLTEEQKAEWEKSGYDFTDRLINGIKAGVGRLVEMGRAMIQSLWDGAVEKFDELLAWFRDLPSRIIEAIGNIDLSGLIKWPSRPAWLGGGGDASAASAENPANEFAGVDGARAGGGPIRRGRTYLVGEDGPELITPTSDGFVHDAGATKGMMAGGGQSAAAPVSAPNISREVNINLGGIAIHAAPGQDAEQIAVSVMRMVESKIGAALRGVQADTGMEVYG